MDLIKQYIVQSISIASSNLRLNNQRLEVIAMLKDVINKSKDLVHDINQMKKITELSKIAIKLSEIHLYLNEGTLDFMKVSDKFKDHSFTLIKELNHVLDMVNPYTFREKLDHFFEPEKKVVELIIENENEQFENSEKVMTFNDSNFNGSHSTLNKPKTVELELADETAKNENDSNQVFSAFENTILNPIKSLDKFLNQLSTDTEVPVEAEEFSNLMRINAELSDKNGFEILAQMHEIVSKGLVLIKNKSLVPSKEVIESLRACLIVIVAVVKSKEVDIKNYLNRAEVFGKFLQKIKIEETQ